MFHMLTKIILFSDWDLGANIQLGRPQFPNRIRPRIKYKLVAKLQVKGSKISGPIPMFSSKNRTGISELFDYLPKVTTF